MPRVLIGIDDDVERATDQVESVLGLHDSNDLQVTVAYSFSFKSPDDSMEDLESVRSASERLEEASVEYELREGTDEPADYLVSTADEIDADFLCVGGRKRSPAGKALFGSVSQQVILETDRPVLIAGERATE